MEEYPDLSRYAVTSIELILKTVDDFYEGVARGSKHGSIYGVSDVRILGMSPPVKDARGCKLLTKPAASIIQFSHETGTVICTSQRGLQHVQLPDAYLVANLTSLTLYQINTFM